MIGYVRRREHGSGEVDVVVKLFQDTTYLYGVANGSLVGTKQLSMSGGAAVVTVGEEVAADKSGNEPDRIDECLFMFRILLTM